MAKILKGFVQIDSLQSTVPGTISRLGELSIWSLTFTKDKTEFSDPDVPGYRLVATSHLNEQGQRIDPDQILVKEIIKAVKHVYAYTNTHSAPFDVEDFRATMIAELYNDVNRLKFGPLMTNEKATLPEWLEWESLGTPGTMVKIWLSDEAFSSQYDLYDVVVIPPFEHLDDFFGLPNDVRAKLSAITASQMMDTIQAAKSRNPETYIRTETFKYVSPRIGEPKTDTNWTVLIYGLQGDNIDAIKDAIVDFVLKNSTHTREQWEAIMPDLFKRTEFVILPRWDKIAIADLAVQSGIYSSISTPQETIRHAVSKISFYTQPWIETEGNLKIIPFVYKGVSLDVVKGPNNDTFADSFEKLFADYVALSPSSLDFNRLKLLTQQWIILIERMLIVAENFESYTTIPEPFRIIYRDNKKYLSAYFNNVNFIMDLKLTQEAVVPAI